MNLKTYVKSLTPEQRKVFCHDANFSPSYLSQLLSDSANSRNVGSKTLITAYVASGGVVQFDCEYEEQIEAERAVVEKRRQLRAERESA